MNGQKTYLIGFNALSIGIQQFTAFLDARPEISNWYSVLPGQVFVVTILSPRALALLVEARYQNELFVVARLEPEGCDGSLPADAWEFVNNAPLNATDYASVSTEP